MKVLVCASEYYPFTPMGGIGMCVHNVTKHLKKMRIECDVCSPYGPDIKIPLRFIDRNFGVLWLLRYWHRVSKHFKRYINNYDVVWLHQPFLLEEVPFENCLVTMHTSIFDYNKIVQKGDFPVSLKFYYGIREKIEKRCIQRINRYASYFSVVSPFVASALENVGISPTKIVYIPNGVDIYKFKPVIDKKGVKKSYGFSDKDIIFTFVGRMTWVKQPFTLIKFFSELSQQLKNVSLIVVGDGELLKDVKHIASSLHLKKILFLGRVSNEKLPSIFACSDFYLMTSLYEGQPITLLEALSSGIPPIVSDIPSLRHIIKEAGVGLAIDFSNVEAAVAKTIDFIRNENIAQQSFLARKFVEKNFAWDKISKRYEQFLRWSVHGTSP
jgi:glycosyltransferase involved in cell wall biosynthesis